MRGRAVFYPMGWDDNGLPTERRVQNYFGVRCDPSLPYDPDFVPPAEPPKEPIAVSRPNFVALCHQLTLEDEQVFEHLWRTLGLSVDWSHTYATIGERAQRVSQRGFLRLAAAGPGGPAHRPHPVGRGLPHRGVPGRAGGPRAPRRLPPAPVPPGRRRRRRRDRDHPARAAARPAWPWSPTPTTAATGRCSAPTVATPLFGVRVPVVAHELADPEKGSGIAMVCTFGDTTDVVWWRELDLPTRTVVGSGRPAATGDLGSRRVGVRRPRPAAEAAYDELAGRTVRQAQTRIVELLAESGDLIGEPTPDHPPGQVLREGRPTARDRVVPPVVRRAPSPYRERAAGPGRGAAAGTPPTWPTATGPGWRA